MKWGKLDAKLYGFLIPHWDCTLDNTMAHLVHLSYLPFLS